MPPASGCLRHQDVSGIMRGCLWHGRWACPPFTIQWGHVTKEGNPPKGEPLARSKAPHSVAARHVGRRCRRQPRMMPEASQRVAGGARSDTTGSHSQEGPHPGRGARAAAPKKPTRQRAAPTEYARQRPVLGSGGSAEPGHPSSRNGGSGPGLSGPWIFFSGRAGASGSSCFV